MIQQFVQQLGPTSNLMVSDHDIYHQIVCEDTPFAQIVGLCMGPLTGFETQQVAREIIFLCPVIN